MGEQPEGFFEGTTRKGTVKMSEDQKQFALVLSKIKPEAWKSLNKFMDTSLEIIKSGGLYNTFKSEITRIKDDLINMIVDPILAPILEELGPEIAKLVEKITPMVADLGKFVAELLGIEVGGKSIIDLLGAILEFASQIPSVFSLLFETEKVAAWIWKKLGDIFGFETEGGGVSDEGTGSSPAWYLENLRRISEFY